MIIMKGHAAPYHTHNAVNQNFGSCLKSGHRETSALWRERMTKVDEKQNSSSS